MANERQVQQSEIKQLISKGLEQGYLTYAEVNDHLPDDVVDPEQLEDIIGLMTGMGGSDGLVRRTQAGGNARDTACTRAGCTASPILAPCRPRAAASAATVSVRTCSAASSARCSRSACG